MRLNQNLSSLNIFREHTKILKKQSTALEHICSGEKINNSGEAPNQIAKSERMRIQIRSLQMAQKNVQDGVSMAQTADGGLDSMTSILHRIRELTIQYGSGANSENDKLSIENEIKQMVAGYDDIAKNTEFNGIKLFDKKDTLNEEMQIGANANENVKIPFKHLTSKDVGIDELNLTNLDETLEKIDSALQQVTDHRSKFGALVNKFDNVLTNLAEFELSTQSSESNIRDADIAEEMIEFARCNILCESGHAMMAQSNKLPQDVLRILENVRVR